MTGKSQVQGQPELCRKILFQKDVGLQGMKTPGGQHSPMKHTKHISTESLTLTEWTTHSYISQSFASELYKFNLCVVSEVPRLQTTAAKHSAIPSWSCQVCDLASCWLYLFPRERIDISSSVIFHPSFILPFYTNFHQMPLYKFTRSYGLFFQNQILMLQLTNTPFFESIWVLLLSLRLFPEQQQTLGWDIISLPQGNPGLCLLCCLVEVKCHSCSYQWIADFSWFLVAFIYP